MKKLSIILAVSALALAGCAKDDTNTVPETTKYVKVSIPVPSQTRTSVNGDTYTTHWHAGDAIRLYVKTADGQSSDYKFTVHENGHGQVQTSFTGEVPESLIDNVVLVSACYPYDEQLSYTWDNGWVISESFLDAHHTYLSDYDIVYTLATEAKMEYTDDTHSEAELEADMVFRPLMARIKVSIPEQYDFDVFTLEADAPVFPTHGTVNEAGFNAEGHVYILPFAPTTHEFYIGVLPFSGSSTTVSADFRKNGQWAMTGMTFSLGGLESNTFYTLDITSATTKPHVINVSDEVDKMYGTGTADRSIGIFEPEDPTGSFDGWKFYFAELKKAGNTSGSDILEEMNRIQLQTNTSLSQSDLYGAFCTAPIYFPDDEPRKVKVTFTGASNNVSNRDYIIGSFKDGVEITPASLHEYGNYTVYQDGTIDGRIAISKWKEENIEHTFEIASGQRIAFCVKSGYALVSAHVELGNFKIEFMD